LLDWKPAARITNWSPWQSVACPPGPGTAREPPLEVERVLKEYLESSLRRIERDQMRFFELSLEMFCIAGLDGYFRQINANFPRTLGFTESELLASPFVDFVHPEDIEATAEAVADLSQGQKVVGFANRYRHAAGHYIRLEWSARAIPEEGVIYAGGPSLVVTEIPCAGMVATVGEASL